MTRHPFKLSLLLTIGVALTLLVLLPGDRGSALAYRYDPGIQVSILGEDGVVENVCSVAFDTYLASKDAWSSRISNFATSALQEMAGRLTDYLFCNIPEVQIGIEIAPSFVGTSGGGETTTTEVTKRPECVWQLSGGDVTGILQDSAERQLTYDSILRCTARTMLDDVIDGMLRITRENGRDGGPTWVQDYGALITDAEARGRAVSRNLFGNTQYCDWIQESMQYSFGFDPDTTGPLLENVDSSGRAPYTQRGGCGFPPGTTSEDLAQYPQALMLLALPQNNIYGAYLMAQEEMQYQINLQRTADLTEAVAGNGYLGSRGTNAEEGCAQQNEQGECEQYIPIIQPGYNFAATVDNTQEAELQWIITSDKMGSLIGDMRGRILSRIQDLTAPDIHFAFEPDPAQRRYTEDTGEPVPTEPTAECTQDPTASGYCGIDNLDKCECLHVATVEVCEPGSVNVSNAIATQEFVDNYIKRAVGTVAFDLRAGNPPYEGSQGIRFVQEVCLELNRSGLSFSQCHPHQRGGETLLVYNFSGHDVLVDIIRGGTGPGAGGARQNPTVKYACAAGYL